MNFTPSAFSLVVLNVATQNQLIFSDAASFNSFKKHCSALKANLEQAPKPANALTEQDAADNGSTLTPPKAWIYRLSDTQNLNSDLE